jgi:hypothetical protein
VCVFEWVGSSEGEQGRARDVFRRSTSPLLLKQILVWGSSIVTIEGACSSLQQIVNTEWASVDWP